MSVSSAVRAAEVPPPRAGRFTRMARKIADPGCTGTRSSPGITDGGAQPDSWCHPARCGEILRRCGAEELSLLRVDLASRSGGPRRKPRSPTVARHGECAPALRRPAGRPPFPHTAHPEHPVHIPWAQTPQTAQTAATARDLGDVGCGARPDPSRSLSLGWKPARPPSAESSGAARRLQRVVITARLVRNNRPAPGKTHSVTTFKVIHATAAGRAEVPGARICWPGPRRPDSGRP